MALSKNINYGDAARISTASINRIVRALIPMHHKEEGVQVSTFDLKESSRRDISIAIKRSDSLAYNLAASKGSKKVTLTLMSREAAGLVYDGQILTDGVFPKAGQGAILEKIAHASNEAATIDIRGGAIGVIARKAGGKSTVATHIATKVATRAANAPLPFYLSLGEPESLLKGTEMEVFIGIFLGAVSTAEVIVIDSLRTVINEMDGQLKEGGISRALSGFFTQIERIASAHDLNIVFTVNPSSVKADALAMIKEDMAGSIAYTIELSDIRAITMDGVNEVLRVSAAVHRRYNKRDDFPFLFECPILDAELDEIKHGIVGPDDLRANLSKINNLL